MDKRYFSDKVVEWYHGRKRNLPWRDTQDPYKIWLSEIILQQTRVAQGLPYYLRFTEKFPDVRALAAASEQEVLRLWQGLGYYTRARNLHKCAKEVVSQFHGTFPDNFLTLKTLPGIGDYTAAAIASFAFREPVAVVDGNVFRVLSRIFGIETEINSPEGKKVFTALANELISKKHPDLHNQAIMEFGALYCTPARPLCEQCIFVSTCFAARNNLQEALPVKAKAKAARPRYFYYYVIRKGKSTLMKKREQKDIWHGLYDFYVIEKVKPANPVKIMEQDPLLKKLNRNQPVISKKYKHILSHQIIHATFVTLADQKIGAEEPGLKYYSAQKISDLPKPVLISKFLEDDQLL
jgi:A/G-specific adenine glycosylase